MRDVFQRHLHILDVDVAGQLERGHDGVDEVGFAVVTGWVGASYVEGRAVDNSVCGAVWPARGERPVKCQSCTASNSLGSCQ